MNRRPVRAQGTDSHLPARWDRRYTGRGSGGHPGR